MDEFTKAKVKRAMVDNPDLHVKVIVTVIRFHQTMDKMLKERKYRNIENNT